MRVVPAVVPLMVLFFVSDLVPAVAPRELPPFEPRAVQYLLTSLAKNKQLYAYFSLLFQGSSFRGSFSSDLVASVCLINDA